MDAELRHLRPMEAALRLGAELELLEENGGWSLLAEVGQETVVIGVGWVDPAMMYQPKHHGRTLRFEGVGIFKGTNLLVGGAEVLPRLLRTMMLGAGESWRELAPEVKAELGIAR